MGATSSRELLDDDLKSSFKSEFYEEIIGNETSKSSDADIVLLSKPGHKDYSLPTLFKEFLLDDDKELDEFDYTKFDNCSKAHMRACLNILFEHFYKDFRTIIICREILYKIFLNARYKLGSKTAYTEAFDEIFNRELQKISNGSNWSDVVMFGAFLTRLLENHDVEIFVVTKHMKIWILELIKSSAGGNENALIAYMLIMRRLWYKINPFRGSYIQFTHLLIMLLKNGSSESKSKKISEYLEHCSMLDDHTSLDILKFRKSTKKSKICKEMKIFLESNDEHIPFDLNFFKGFSFNELEYMIKELINECIQKPHKMKFLSVKAFKLQRIITQLIKIQKTTDQDLRDEINKLKNGENSIPIMNLATFIGGMKFFHGFGNYDIVTEWLTCLSELEDTVALTATLKICGWFYREKEPEKYIECMKTIGPFASEVNEECRKISKIYAESDREGIIEYLDSTLFHAEDGAKIIDDLEIFISEISKDRNVDFNYHKFYDFSNLNSFIARKPFLREISKSSANVTKLAQFCKTLFILESNIATFIGRLKLHLDHKIAEMPVDRPDEMINVGRFIAELRNTSTINNLVQNKWLGMIESLEPEKDVKILEIQLEVLKLMMLNLYIQEDAKYFKYLDYIKGIKTSDPKIKSKILQITQNAFYTAINDSSKSTLYRVRLGWKVDSIPYDIPSTSSTDFDLNDFTKLFYLNATVNRYFMDNCYKSLKFLNRGSRGLKFSDILHSKSMDRFQKMLHLDYFDEHQAPMTLQFILVFYPQEFFELDTLTSFLNEILNFEDFDAHKKCFETLIQIIKKDAMFNDFLRHEDRDSKVFKLLRNIQAKLTNIKDSPADETDEIEIWHIVDCQGHAEDKDSTMSEHAWSFTNNYKENREKRQKILENIKKSAPSVDSLAQNFMDFTRNFHQIRKPDQLSRNLAQSAQKSQTSGLNIRILPEKRQ